MNGKYRLVTRFLASSTMDWWHSTHLFLFGQRKQSVLGGYGRNCRAPVMRAINTNSAKIIPCLLDTTPLPPLIADRCGIDFTDTRDGIEALLGELTGERTRKRRMMAIQKALEEMDVTWITHPAVIPLLCCPDCGETETLEAWQEQDTSRGDTYAGMRCTKCGWSGGGEL